MANATNLSGFPATIDSFDRVSDLDEETLAKSEIYKNLINSGHYEDAEQYLEDNPDLAECAINATMINKHSDAIVAIENETIKKKPNYYGVCTTSTSSNIKTTTINNLVLRDGVEITVLFSNDLGDPSMSTVYLNVNNTVDGIIRYRGGNLPGGYSLPASPYFLPSIKSGQIVTFKFTDDDHVYWDVVGTLDNAGSCLFFNVNGTSQQFAPAQNNTKTLELNPTTIGAASYEEGTWIPQLLRISPVTGDIEAVSTSSASGSYYIVGRICFFNVEITVSGSIPTTTTLYIGLPKNGRGTNVGVATWNYSGNWSILEDDLDTDQNYSTHCYIGTAAANKMKVMANNNISVTGCLSGASLIVSGWYITTS